MSTQTNTPPEVKPAVISRRVRVLTINHIDIALPADICDNRIGEIISILDRSRVLYSHYHGDGFAYFDSGALRVKLESEVRAIYPTRAAAMAAHQPKPDPYAEVNGTSGAHRVEVTDEGVTLGEESAK